MGKLPVLLLVSVAAATVIGLGYRAGGEPYAERLVRLEAADALPGLAPELADEPTAVNAVFLSYAGDEALVLNARLALIRYPEMSRRVLPLYGLAPEFQEILRRHGAEAIPPIHYFLTHEIRTLQLMRYTGVKLRQAADAATRLWDDESPPAMGPMDSEDAARALTAGERGWYAVNFIRDEGHDFLGQFRVDADGEVAWVQTERVLEGTTGFFAGGIRDLEAKYRTDRDVSAEDYLWAGVDVLVVAGAVKALRAGRAVGRAARTGTAGRGTAAVSAGALGTGRLARGAFTAGAVAATGYVVLRHPQLISNLAAEAAHLMGVPAWLAQIVVWSVILLPALYLGLWLLRLVVRPLLLGVHGTAAGLAWLQRRVSPAPR